MRPNCPTSTPPSSPPNGISAKHIAPVSEVTRPMRGCGMRSNMTAPSTGLMNPEPNPETTANPSTTQSGMSKPRMKNRGAPQMRNANR